MDYKNAIEITNVSKSFKIEVEDKTKKATLINKKPTKTIDNVVINNVSLNIRKGDVLGILGKNGSGKSTFLAMLAKIMEPDSGQIERSGKIASILELGMGFHPDMTGRENIYLKGELYGFSKKEIDQKIDRIIEYSGIKKYIDNPVRTYSSGMSGRLAFAIMVNVDADIMLVDEVLSVGDAAFSAKAFQHFRKLASTGKTIIIVSHSINVFEEICNRVIWIEDGRIIKDGPSKEICAQYRNEMNESPEIISDLALNGIADAQYKLALMYRDGQFFGQDEELFEYWIKQSAMQGHTKAQVEYADILIKSGEESEAIAYYQSAANKGDSGARTKLSTLSSQTNTLRNKLINIFAQLASEEDSINEFRYADILLKTAWNNNDRKLAFDYFLKSADKGYPQAMHQVGLLFKEGIGAPRDISKMEQYLLKAADSGFIPSITALADMYEQGTTLPKNERRAFKYSKLAAGVGIPGYMYRVATQYRDGIGTEQNIELSEYWFQKYSNSNLLQHIHWAIDYCKCDAQNEQLLDYLIKELNTCAVPAFLSESIDYNIINNIDTSTAIATLDGLSKCGNIDATRKLADRYYSGIGVEIDCDKSLSLYMKASSLGDPWSSYKVGEIIRSGKSSIKDFKKASDYFALSSNQLVINSIVNLISMHLTDQINDRNIINNCFKLLNSLAKSGNSEAMLRLGDYFYLGMGVERNHENALKWYEKGSLVRNMVCCYKAAEMYRDGKGCKKDYKKAYSLFNDAAALGHSAAGSAIIELYTKNYTTNSDVLATGVDHLIRIANSGNVDAIRRIGNYYFDGVTGKRDYVAAAGWYIKAARFGDMWTINRLNTMFKNELGINPLINENEKIKQVVASKLFDMDWYYNMYLSKSDIDKKQSISHYLRLGWKLFYDPSDNFSTFKYLNKYPEVKNSDFCPLLHYIVFGQREGKNLL